MSIFFLKGSLESTQNIGPQNETYERVSHKNHVDQSRILITRNVTKSQNKNTHYITCWPEEYKRDEIQRPT